MWRPSSSSGVNTTLPRTRTSRSKAPRSPRRSRWAIGCAARWVAAARRTMAARRAESTSPPRAAARSRRRGKLAARRLRFSGPQVLWFSGPMVRLTKRPDALRAPGRCVFAVLGAIFALAGHSRAEQSQAPLTLSCSARPQLTTPDLTRLFGNAASVVARGWRDEARSQLSSVAVTVKDSGWKTPEGIKVGMAIADVEELNKRAFVMRGFDQPDAGLVVSWAGGRLDSKDDDGCRIAVRLAPTVDHFTTLE